MTQSTANPILSIETLSKLYPGCEQPAVDSLSITVERGSIFGLLGPNGAGKTTTISILCTLLRPTSGTVTVLGHDVVSQANQVRRRIGLVPQEIALYPSLTARENLRYFARVLGLPKKQLEARVEESLELVGLLDCADQRIDTYSGGMKRRANLAVGVLHRPEILFLDEPTVGIDAQSRNLILERLAELNRAGMTLIYTTHYMEEVQQLCDQIAIIDAGKVIASGSPSKLVAEQSDCQNLEELFLKLTGKQLRD